MWKGGKGSPHNTKDNRERDKNGVYTLISCKDKFQYFGAKNFSADEIKNILGDKYPLRQETKIVDDCNVVNTIRKIVGKNEELEKDTAEKSRNQNQYGECKHK